MSRPTTNTDLRLIKAAKELIPQVGTAGLNLRQVAKKADVNLGMFHYHFKTKNEFIKRVFENIYEEFFKSFSLIYEKEQDPEEALRGLLLSMARFSRDNRKLLASLFGDLLNKEEIATGFVRENIGRHVKPFMEVIQRGQKDGVFESMPMAQAVSFLMASVNLPNVIAGHLDRMGRGGKIPLEIDKAVLSDAALEQRVEMALRGLARVSPKTKRKI
ncbi:TetR/AcrR family transcriptional regulator [Bdellovibrio sp. HCB337]|uniref:TetR/AcrR family transcriptional regulator n=1 Tax=Bdellovibrio sp. HCB337 TaxID=3394358 RepID=UPI0039A4EC9D